jgi:hypothetical protein
VALQAANRKRKAPELNPIFDFIFTKEGSQNQNA